MRRKRYIRNIMKVYSQTTEDERQHGHRWYVNANQIAKEIGSKYGLPYQVVAHVIAALSPGIRWEINVRDAEALIREELTGQAPNHGYATYGHNVKTARRIAQLHLTGQQWDNVLNGPKVKAFAANIVDPHTPNTPVIDFHAFSVADGKRYKSNSAPRLTKGVLKEITAAYCKAAETINVPPQVLQATTWLTWRRQVSQRAA